MTRCASKLNWTGWPWDWMDDAEPIEVTLEKARRGVVTAHRVDRTPPPKAPLDALAEAATQAWARRPEALREAALFWAETRHSGPPTRIAAPKRVPRLYRMAPGQYVTADQRFYVLRTSAPGRPTRWQVFDAETQKALPTRYRLKTIRAAKEALTALYDVRPSC